MRGASGSGVRRAGAVVRTRSGIHRRRRSRPFRVMRRGTEERGMGDGLESSVRVTIFRSQRQIEMKSKVPGGLTIRAYMAGFTGWVKGDNIDTQCKSVSAQQAQPLVLHVLMIHNLSLL